MTSIKWTQIMARSLLITINAHSPPQHHRYAHLVITATARSLELQMEDNQLLHAKAWLMKDS